ncbi:MAG: hypothetical protein ACHQF0_14125 [Chitinophagales bacterium]
MKFAIIFSGAGVILLSIAILFDVNYISYSKPVPYSQWKKISFYDFKAFKRPGLTLNGVSEFAFIKDDRRIHYLNNGNIVITTYFHPSRSYVFAQDIRNPDLLRHELYHFHIAEYCARLLRKEISERMNSITNGMVEKLNIKYYKVENEMQNEYDEDSYHSYVLQEQKKWEMKVDSLLHALEAFSEPLIHLGNKE